jgi:hypothetical protein
MTRAPLRFLLAILVLWVGARAAILLPEWPSGTRAAPAAAARPRPLRTAAPARPLTPPSSLAASRHFVPPSYVAARIFRPEIPQRTSGAPTVQLAFALRPGSRALPGSHVELPDQPATPQVPAFGMPDPRRFRLDPHRWTASAWLLVRDEADAALAPGGTLGGSQAGARLTYALGGGFALSGRAYLPLRNPAGAELAGGIDWRPIRSLPVNLIAERRQRLGRDGRSAFGLTLYGGTSRALSPRVRLDAYGQAGMVGLRSRDLFADGAVRVARRLGPVELGAGAWGAAQPGAARLDAGPSLSWRLPIPDANLRLQADWRFRIAGDAMPRSGPALTIAADF